MVRRASDLLSCWVGATEQNIARAFEEARKDDAVLLIDEADSFLQDRRGAGHSWEVTQVNEVLTQMENFEGVFIATTNLIKTLDQAALRRFDMKLLFKPLTARQSRELFLRHAATLGIADTLNNPSMECFFSIRYLNNPRLKARGFLTRCRLSRNSQGF